VYREDKKPRDVENLDKFDTPELVAMLQSPNGFQRDLAQQMLFWRNDEKAVEPLRKVLKESKESTSRLAALCTLDVMGKLEEKDLLLGLEDDHAGVRRHAVRCSEKWLDKSKEVLELVFAQGAGEDAFARVQVAYSVGESKHSEAPLGIAELLETYRDDPILTAAALSSVRPDTLGGVLTHIFKDAQNEPPPSTEKLLAMAATLGKLSFVDTALHAILAKKSEQLELWQMQAIARMLETLDAKDPALVSKLDRESFARLDEVEKLLPGIATKGKLEERLAAVRLIPLVTDAKDSVTHLTPLLDGQQPPEVQVAAATALAREGTVAAIVAITKSWDEKTPAVRTQSLDLLLGTVEGRRVLLIAIKNGEVPLQDLDVRRRQTLLNDKDEATRKLAARLIVDKVDANRVKVIEEYTAAMAKLSGDVVRGKEVFGKKCAQCHKLDGVGHDVGPNLNSLTDRSAAAMLVALLDPNRAVEAKFVEYIATTADGRQHRGMLASETSTSLTLVGPEAKQETILRSELDELKSTGTTLMPVGIEKELTPQNVSDVIAYLGGFRPPPKSFPGNKPREVEVRDDGSIRIPANAARIYGPQIVYEEQYGNLGYWSSPEDVAAWDFTTPAASEYKVTLDFACDASAAGNTLVLSAAGNKLTFKVPSTGSWDQYKGQEIGTVKLPKGAVELTVASEGAINGALIDLRSVKLVPIKP
jgi:putative heme-binding domain-containing protein